MLDNIGFLLSFILNAVAIFLGLTARGEIKKSERQSGDGNALMGITSGFVSMGLVIGFFALVVIEQMLF